MTIHYEDAKPLVGAIVRASKSDLRDPEFAREFLDLLDRRAVVVLPEIDLSDDEQLAFTDLLGVRSDFARRMMDRDGEESEIYKVTLDQNVKADTTYVLATWFWHMDGVTVESDPPRATLLSARKVAPEGGETEFASTIAAYEALPDAEKAKLDSLRTLHSVYSGVRPMLPFDVTPDNWGGEPGRTQQPLVWTHESGHKSLVLGVQVEDVIGMDLVEARVLISRLMEWATQPDFKYRHTWRKGDLVVWKNLAAMHRVVPYAADSGRMMHRTSLAKFRKAEALA